MMKFLKAALLLNLALIANIGHALDVPDVDIRVDTLRGTLTVPPNGQIQVTGFQQFNSGAIISVSSTPENWSVLNRVYDNAEIRLIYAGNIKLTSPGSIVLSGSATPDTRISLSASAVPEVETYSMLLAGLGLIGAIIRRRKLSK
jgi:hypothetical protein